MQKYTKIDTLYKRYQFTKEECPNEKWLRLRNKIIMGDFTNKVAEYLFDCPWEAYSKVDGTNSKIAYFPSTGTISVGGKTDSAESISGQFEMLREIGERIRPMLAERFPKDTARFRQVLEDGTKLPIYHDADGNCVVPNKEGNYEVTLVEVPIYIYGEYYGKGVNKNGKRYIKDGNGFLVFDICIQGWWIPRELRDEICAELGLKTVPYLGTMTLAEIESMVQGGFETKVEGISDPSLIEEGIVARPTVPLNDGRGNRVIVKLKHKDYTELDVAVSELTQEEFYEFKEWYHGLEARRNA